MDRFFCNRLMLGEEAVNILAGSTVNVIGIGAVGGYAVEGLTRYGVGALRLVDIDKIKVSNINRHICATESSIGKYKVDAVKGRVADINPCCRVDAVKLFADDDNIDRILDNGPDIVIDAIDSLNPKVRVLKRLYDLNVKTVSSMGAAMRTDPFKIAVDDLMNTAGCPLAQRLRKRLRALGVGKGIRCVYSFEKSPKAFSGKDAAAEGDEFMRGRERKKMGSLPVIPGIFGLIIARETAAAILASKLNTQTQ